MTEIESVARSLAGCNYDKYLSIGKNTREDYVDNHWEVYINEAKAAINAPSDGTNSGTGDPNHDENDQRNHSHNWKEDVYRIQSHHWVLIGLSLFLSEQLLSVLIGRLLVSDECPHLAVSTGSIDIVECPYMDSSSDASTPFLW